MTRMIRLYTDMPLAEETTVSLTKAQAHYLRNVLRQDVGKKLYFFNGQDGEWQSEITALSKNHGTAVLQERIKKQEILSDLWIACAPVKKDRFDFCLEKTVELGASDFIPVYTEFTDIKRVNIDRLSSNAIEAAQQCGATALVNVHDAHPLPRLIADWPQNRPLYICAERGTAPAFIDTLQKQRDKGAGILIGPEGGFSDPELALLSDHPMCQFVHLGPLTLRTETALAAAISLYQSVKGNWVGNRN